MTCIQITSFDKYPQLFTVFATIAE